MSNFKENDVGKIQNLLSSILGNILDEIVDEDFIKKNVEQKLKSLKVIIDVNIEMLQGQPLDLPENSQNPQMEFLNKFSNKLMVEFKKLLTESPKVYKDIEKKSQNTFPLIFCKKNSQPIILGLAAIALIIVPAVSAVGSVPIVIGTLLAIGIGFIAKIAEENDITLKLNQIATLIGASIEVGLKNITDNKYFKHNTVNDLQKIFSDEIWDEDYVKDSKLVMSEDFYAPEVDSSSRVWQETFNNNLIQKEQVYQVFKAAIEEIELQQPKNLINDNHSQSDNLKFFNIAFDNIAQNFSLSR